MSAKVAHRGKPQKPKPDESRGWHVDAFLPSPEGLTEAEARRLYDSLMYPQGAKLIPPPEGDE